MFKILFSIASMVLAGGILFLYTQPTYDEIRTIRGTQAVYTQALDKAAELQKLKQTLLDRYKSFDPGDLERLRKSVPDHVDNVRLVLDLDSLATRHGMGLQNVLISDTGSASEQNKSTIGAPPTSKYDSLMLRFTLHGSYGDFVSFLEDLESSLRLVDVIALDISPDASLKAATSTYAYDMSVRTYWLK